MGASAQAWKNIDVGHTSYYVLYSGVTGHWTKSDQISKGCTEMIEIKIAIFRIRSVSECQWRSSSNCGRIVAKIALFHCEIIGRTFTTFVHDVAGLLLLIFWKRLHNQPIGCRTPQQRVKVVPSNVCEHYPNLTGCHSNITWTTAKRISG